MWCIKWMHSNHGLWSQLMANVDDCGSSRCWTTLVCTRFTVLLSFAIAVDSVVICFTDLCIWIWRRLVGWGWSNFEYSMLPERCDSIPTIVVQVASITAPRVVIIAAGKWDWHFTILLACKNEGCLGNGFGQTIVSTRWYLRVVQGDQWAEPHCKNNYCKARHTW